MKLHWSPRSPFVRKVMVTAHELALADRLTLRRTLAAMTRPNPELLPDNPLSRIPTLLLDDGSALYDSVVICEYLDTLHDGPKLFPGDGAAHWTALRRHALADGMLEILVLWRNERERPDGARSQPHVDAFRTKIEAALDTLEKDAAAIAAARMDIGHIAVGCALSYMDFRFADDDWRPGRPRLTAWHKTFDERPSMRATVPSQD
jgi:glutathione S-transferase